MRRMPSTRFWALTGAAVACLAAQTLVASPPSRESASMGSPDRFTDEVPLGDAAPLAQQGKPVVTFSGLRTYEDGSSTLRVNVSQVVPVQQTAQGKKLSFVLSGAKVQLRTNRYALYAEYFGNNVLRTQLTDVKDGVQVDIHLRTAVTPAHQVMRHAGGAIVRIDIPSAEQK